MEPQAPLVRTDGRAELDAVAPVHPDAALVVLPGDAEGNHPVRLHQALHDAGLFQLRARRHIGLQGLEYLSHRLQKLRLRGVILHSVVIDTLQIRIFQHSSSISIAFVQYHKFFRCLTLLL